MYELQRKEPSTSGTAEVDAIIKEKRLRRIVVKHMIDGYKYNYCAVYNVVGTLMGYVYKPYNYGSNVWEQKGCTKLTSGELAEVLIFMSEVDLNERW